MSSKSVSENQNDAVGLCVRIAVETGPHAGTVVTWQRPGSYLIGRGTHTQLALPHDLTASVEHCRLEIKEHGCVIQDLGSRQGTLVDGAPQTRALVESGSTIQVGMSQLALTISAAADPEATVLRRSQWTATGATVIAAEGHVAGEPAGVLDIPGYSISRKLGAGGMGVVYEARRRASGERVALKTIIPVPGAGQSSILLFRREMELLSQIEHPRIVRFIESGEHAGQIYLVMEYVDAVELATLVERIPRDRQIQIYCAVICQVLEALEFAHQRKLVHRDVKPRNILVSRGGRRLHVKLADFGLAKNFELAGLSQLTGDNEIRGTPAFMPWEQLQNSRYAKPAVDIYSTAATLFYYLTGRSPGHSSPSSPMELTDLPAGLADALRQALAADPRERFPTAAAMREALLPFSRRA
jgi:serine/threonine-protein kinase